MKIETVSFKRTPCKDGDARFATVPLKALSDKNVEDIVVS